MAVGVAVGWWPLILPGVALLVWWFAMFRDTVRYIREAPAGVGLVGAMTPHPHPLMPDYSTGVALLTDGREVPVAFPTRLASGILGGGKRVEIFFLHDPRAAFSIGLGARPAPEQGG
jgi:hypothetical protein